MKTKFKFLIAGVLALGLIIAGTASALANPTVESIGDLSQTNEVTAEELDALVAELEALEDVQIIPRPEDENATVEILGGFHGRWGMDEADGPLGGLAGIYGTVTYEDGTGYGFLGGIWKQRDERTLGYLIGRYADGAFWGIYRNYAGENGGVFGGTYDVSENDAEALINRFVGEWKSSDGERSGYMKGTWAAKVGIRRVGRFGGKYFINDNETNVTDERPHPDGQFRGHYGVMKLADDTKIHLFRGGWLNNDGEVGKLTGIGVRGHFYGVWKGEDNSGYLMGKAKENHMRGVFGTFGEEPQGRLIGRYGPYPSPEVEPEQVEPDTVDPESALPEEVDSLVAA